MPRKTLVLTISWIIALTLLSACGGEEKKTNKSEDNAEKALAAAFAGNVDEAGKYICQQNLEDIGPQSMRFGIPFLPFRYKAYEYEGDEYRMYLVEINGESKPLALVKPGRLKSSWIDPANPTAGLIEWEGSWRALNPIWQFDPQATSAVEQVNATRRFECTQDGEKMSCKIELDLPKNMENPNINPPYVDYTLTMNWDRVDGKLCNASVIVPEEWQ